jgi:ComF family protein
MPSWGDALASTFLPAACGRCRLALGAGHRASVCRACWEAVLPHAGSTCPACGRPELGEAGPCLVCRDTPPVWTAAASFGPYDGALRDLILLLKMGKRDELAVPLARLLVGTWRSCGWPLPDAVVPAPMHWWRRWRRGFNQAGLLAGELAELLCAPAQPVVRRHGGLPQVGRSRSERLKLSSRGFSARRAVHGSILLVDDVLTTGATAMACTRALLRAGAVEVRILTLARTPDPRSLR